MCSLNAFAFSNLLRHLVTVAALLLMIGCVPVLPLSPPFEEEINSIVVGTTTREEVIAILGDPWAKRRAGKLAIYFRSRSKGGIISAWGGVGIVGMNLLVVRFDDKGLVSDVETQEKTDVASNAPVDFCIASGECVIVREPDIVVFATPEEDKAAKEFKADEGSCTIFLYFEKHSIFFAQAFVDGQQLGSSTDLGYIHHQVLPGPREVSVRITYDPDSVSFDCGSGQTLFLRSYFRGLFRGYGLELVDESEGQTAILERKLVLLN